MLAARGNWIEMNAIRAPDGSLASKVFFILIGMSKSPREFRLPLKVSYFWDAKIKQENSTMKYLLMMNVPTGGDYQITSWPKKDIEAHMGYMFKLNDRLRAAGEFVGVEALTSPAQAKLVRAGLRGKPITDGIFPETKEFLAGYWIVDVATPQRAYEVAAEASAAPGVGGAPLNMPIEVREIMTFCDHGAS